MEVTLPDVSDNPVILYMTLLATSGWILATIFPQITGRFQKAVKEASANRRAAAAEADDADIAQRDRQIAYLRGMAAAQIQELQDRDRLIADHKAWDWERYDAARRAGQDVPAPPPLLPPARPPVDWTGSDETDV